MLYREIIAVCSQIHTEHINTLCGQNVELLNVKLVVHIMANLCQRVDPTIINKSQNASPRDILSHQVQSHRAARSY